jgi:hypothetical protein
VSKSFHRGSAIVACCLVIACKVVTDGGTPQGQAGQSSAGHSGQTQPIPADGKDAGGTAGKPAVSQGGLVDAASSSGRGATDAGIHDASLADASEAAGADGSSLDGGASMDDGGTLVNVCDVDGGCISTCPSSTLTCAVENIGIACEFAMFSGASAAVPCGQTATVGTACCGGCGCVAVELFNDGQRCWQGIPDCTLSEFANLFFEPHAP